MKPPTIEQNAQYARAVEAALVAEMEAQRCSVQTIVEMSSALAILQVGRMMTAAEAALEKRGT